MNVEPQAHEPIAKGGPLADESPYSLAFEDLRNKMTIPSEYILPPGLHNSWAPDADGWQPIGKCHPLQVFVTKYSELLKTASEGKRKVDTFRDQDDIALLIREFFPELVQTVWRLIWEEDYNVAIVGQHGLGKSAAMSFIMACMLAIHPGYPFLFFRESLFLVHLSQVYFYKDARTCLPYNLHYRLLCFIPEPDDGVHSLPYAVRSRIRSGKVKIIQASSQANNYGCWARETAVYVEVALPFATEEEIVAMAMLDEETCKYLRRFPLSSGNPLNEVAIMDIVYESPRLQTPAAIHEYQTYSTSDSMLDPTATRKDFPVTVPPDPTNVKEKCRPIVALLVKQLGYAPQYVLNAIADSSIPHRLVDAAIQEFSRGDWKQILRGLGMTHCHHKPPSASSTLFKVTARKPAPSPYAIASQDTTTSFGVIVRPEWHIDFQSDFIRDKFIHVMDTWGNDRNLEMFRLLQDMGRGVTAAALLRYFFEPLSILTIARLGMDLHTMKRMPTTARRHHFETDSTPSRATDCRLEPHPTGRRNFEADPIVLDTYVQSSNFNHPLFNAYCAEKVDNNNVTLWVFQATEPGETTHDGSDKGYDTVDRLKQRIIEDSQASGTTNVKTNWVLVKPVYEPIDSTKKGELNLPLGFEDHEGPVYCAYVKIPWGFAKN